MNPAAPVPIFDPTANAPDGPSDDPAGEVVGDERLCRFASGDRFIRSWSARREASERLPTPIVLGVIHGLGDHSGRFEGVGRWFANRGVHVYCYDQLGHGNSPGRRMVIPSYEHLLRDIDSFVDFLNVAHPGSTIGLFGQSMGGNLVLNHQLRDHAKVPLVIAGSPMLRAVNPPGPGLMFFLRMLSNLMPHYKLAGDVDPAGLTRDPVMQRAFESDPLVQRGITLRLGKVLIDTGRWALEHAGQLETPALIVHGDADPITCHRASLEFARHSRGRAEVRVWPGAPHDLHHDIVREEYLRHLFDWIVAVVG